MDASRLQLSIPVYRLSQDNSNTYLYDIEVVYGKLRWTVSHRFNDFLALAEHLSNQQFDAIPQPPPKTFTRPHDRVSLDGRRILLQSWLYSVCQRPDLRNSPQFLEFIEFELQTSTVVSTSLLPQLYGIHYNSRLRASDCVFIPSLQPESSFGSIFVSYEENIHISRLGKVWSVIEHDELGAISLLSLQKLQQPDLPSRHPIRLKCIADISVPYRAHVIYYHNPTHKVFCGTDSGCLKVYSLIQSTERSTETTEANGNHAEKSQVLNNEFSELVKSPKLGFLHIADIILHQDTINCLRGDTDHDYFTQEQNTFSRLLSIGADHAIRILNCYTLKTVCGGRIQKRLQAGEELTIGILEHPSVEFNHSDITFFEKSTSPKHASSISRMHNTNVHGNLCTARQNETSYFVLPNTRLIIGTTSGHIFILNCGVHPPKFLTCIKLKEAISAIELAGNTCLVGHGNSISIIKLSKNRLSTTATFERSIEMPFNNMKKEFIRSITITKTTPLLFVAYGKSILMWDCTKYQCVGVFKAHASSIRRMHVIEIDSDVILISISNDGYVKLWKIPPFEHLTHWYPQTSHVACESNHWKEKYFSEEPIQKLSEEEDDSLLLTNISAVPHRH